MADEVQQRTGQVEFARLPENVAVVRIVGRCNFHNSAYLEKAAELCEQEIDGCRYVLDFDRCESMDSTFLGAVAGLALRQRDRGGGNLIAVNVSPPLRRSMEVLGLTHVLDLRSRKPEVEAEREIEVTEDDSLELPRADQVAHMIESHKKLIEVDSGNEVRFENVIKYLGDSLYRARATEQSPGTENGQSGGG